MVSQVIQCLNDREFYWIVGIRPTLNAALPDFATLDGGKNITREMRVDWSKVRVPPPSPTSPPRTSRGRQRNLCGCGARKYVDNRYCVLCARVAMRKMHRDGYLQDVPPPTRARSSDEREDTGVTKHGSGHG